MAHRKYVEIIWDDAHDLGQGEWVVASDVDPGCQIVTVGILIKSSKKFYTVTHSRADNGDVRGTFNIPKGMVRSIKTLKT